MQRVKPKMSRRKAFLVLFLILAGVGLLVWGGISLFSVRVVTNVTASLLPCPYSDTIMPFGQNVLYYDGVSIHCMSDTGSVRWSFQIGADAGYDCNDSVVVAWAGSTIYILDQNGNSSYNDNLGEEIQFARVGTQYVAAVIGETTSPRLVVKDHTGAHMDEEADAFDTLILLDVGFYGKNGEYMWTLALDVFGTAANTILNTFEVGKMNTGEVSLGEPIAYAVVYENSLLRAVFRFPVLKHLDWLAGGVFGLLLGVVLCFAFFTVLPLLESVVPLTEFRELVDQSALAQVFENGNLIISIMNRRL